jgi:hypothetical protein
MQRCLETPANGVPRHHNRAGEGTRTPNLLFLCGWYRRALAGWHRLASGLVRLRKDTHCLRSSSDRWAGKCGGKCGVSASDRLRVSDVHGSEDSFRVRAERPIGSVHRQTANLRARRPAAGRQRCDWLAVWLSANEMGRKRPLGPELHAGAPLTAMNAARWSCLYLAAVRRVGPNRSKGQCREPS